MGINEMVEDINSLGDEEVDLYSQATCVGIKKSTATQGLERALKNINKSIRLTGITKNILLLECLGIHYTFIKNTSWTCMLIEDKISMSIEHELNKKEVG